VRITAKADYAVRAAVELAARQPDERPIKGEQLARSQGIPQNFLENILTELRRAGIAPAAAPTVAIILPSPPTR
jgi:Rrf2 family protein